MKMKRREQERWKKNTFPRCWWGQRKKLQISLFFSEFSQVGCSFVSVLSIRLLICLDFIRRDYIDFIQKLLENFGEWTNVFKENFTICPSLPNKCGLVMSRKAHGFKKSKKPLHGLLWTCLLTISYPCR